MLIKISIGDDINGEYIDIYVENEQRIKTTIRVLSENVFIGWGDREISEVRIRDTGRRVPAAKTYQEADIYSGAKISVIR